MLRLVLFFAVACATSTGRAPSTNINVAVPGKPPQGAFALDSYPIGASFEFFMWPSYMLNITPPMQCLKHFDELYGKKMPIRIGGTTQDRATYDPNFKGYVSYEVANPLDAPLNLTYGPRFFDLIAQYGGETILGFNRGRNNRTNTFAAVVEADKRAGNDIMAIELGNEPDLYLLNQQPVAIAPWTEVEEGRNNADWAQAFLNIWRARKTPILLGGSYAIPIEFMPHWPNTDYLIDSAYNKTIKDAIKYYSGHLYALSNGTTLEEEMNHVRTVADVSTLVEKVNTAKSVGRDYILGETNFHGLDETMDQTFGGALVTLDRSMRATSIGLKRLYYHQGTINQAFFNWWSDNQVEAPFYGGYMSALALINGDDIVAVDDGTTSHAQYIIYKDGKPSKAVLINTEYYSGSGPRSSTSITLDGLSCRKVKALRFTASSSELATEKGDTAKGPHPTIGGQYFDNKDCAILGKLVYETTAVRSNKAVFRLAASEALIVYL